MNLEVRHLRLVSSIAEEGSLTRAASRLHLTQSALSHQLRDVEEKLGAKIFLRAPRSMTLTPSGNRLLATAKHVLDELERVEREILSAAAYVEETLTLTTQCCTVYYWLPAQLKQYRQSFPKVNVKVIVNPHEEPFAALLDGTVDVVVCCNPERNRKLEFTPLFEDENVLVVPQNHPLARKRYVQPGDLRNETLFVYPPQDHSSFLNKVLRPARVTPKSIQEVLLTEAMIEMIKGGLGVASLAKWIVAPHVPSGSLTTVRIGQTGFWRSWSIATRRSRKTIPHIAAFVKLLAGRDFRIPGGRQRALAKVAFPRQPSIPQKQVISTPPA